MGLHSWISITNVKEKHHQSWHVNWRHFFVSVNSHVTINCTMKNAASHDTQLADIFYKNSWDQFLAVLSFVSIVENQNWHESQSGKTGTGSSNFVSVLFGTVLVFFQFHVPNLRTLPVSCNFPSQEGEELLEYSPTINACSALNNGLVSPQCWCRGMNEEENYSLFHPKLCGICNSHWLFQICLTKFIKPISVMLPLHTCILLLLASL